ncbi:MAG: DUF423 domain-containing protein [Verrucomicrobiota bacterium]
MSHASQHSPTFSLCCPRTWLLFAAFLGFFGVILGAFGAHALKPILTERDSLAAWETATKYQLLHALAIMLAALWAQQESVVLGTLRWAVRCWGAGVVLFSGSIYFLATQGWSWLGPVTPLGGLLMLAGWALFGLATLKGLKKPQNG